MLHDTALGNARMDEFINRRSGEDGRLKPSADSARNQLRWRRVRFARGRTNQSRGTIEARGLV